MNNRYLPLLTATIIALIAIIAGYFVITEDKPLPVFQPSEVNPELVPEDLRATHRGHRIGDFTLISHKNEEITLSDIRNKIVLADFFFVTCPSICPKMATEMKKVWLEYRDNPDVLFVSHTVMPVEDTPEVLNHYADSLEVNNSNWLFLTGDKQEIYKLARRSYMVTKSEGSGDAHDFIHTENFALVDGEGKIRGYYDGTNPDDTEKAIDDINQLLKEKKEGK